MVVWRKFSPRKLNPVMAAWWIIIILCPKICLVAESNVSMIRMLTHEEQQKAQRRLLERFIATEYIPPPNSIPQRTPRFFISDDARHTFLSSVWQKKPLLQRNNAPLPYLFSSSHLDHIFRAGVALSHPSRSVLNPNGQLLETRMVVGEDVDILKRVQGKDGEWWTGNCNKSVLFAGACNPRPCDTHASNPRIQLVQTAATLDVKKIRHLSAAEARSRFFDGFSLRIQQLNKRWPSCVGLV